ncbi:hypothetical protein D3C81_157290 [compost metagenome]
MRNGKALCRCKIITWIVAVKTRQAKSTAWDGYLLFHSAFRFCFGVIICALMLSTDIFDYLYFFLCNSLPVSQTWLLLPYDHQLRLLRPKRHPD